MKFQVLKMARLALIGSILSLTIGPDALALKTLTLKAQFDRVAYSLSITEAKMSFAQGPLRYDVPRTRCNAPAVTGLVRRYEALKVAQSKLTRIPANAWDVRLTEGRSAPRSVPRGDALAVWIRALPRRMGPFAAEAMRTCK